MKKGAFETSRNSRKTAFAWRSTIDQDSVEELQTSCAPSMNILGYRHISENSMDEDILTENFPV